MIILVCIVSFLTACSTTTRTSSVHYDLLSETWIPRVNLNPTIWTHGADNWYFTGEPTPLEREANSAPADSAMTIQAVKVAQFTNISVNGCFKVQIAGEQDHNSVFILGPNDAVRQLTVQVYGDTVFIGQVSSPDGPPASLKNVIVRIGINKLRSLKVSGGAEVEGRNIISNRLAIDSDNYFDGNVLLSGRMNLVSVRNTGSADVSVIGAFTPCLDVIASGSGAVNVSGHVGIHSIKHYGSGIVNIIGADSNDLTIYACSGLTTISGYVNLRKITAEGNACVYIYWVNSNCTDVIVEDAATVGLAGTTSKLDADLSENALFEGQYFRARNVYVSTTDRAHANIATMKELFASSTDQSSVYYYGPTNNVSQNTAGHGAVIHVWGGSETLPVPNAPTFYTMRGPTVYGYSR